MEKRPQTQNSKFYGNDSHPVTRNWFRSKRFVNDPRINLPSRDMDWTSSHKGQMLAVWLIAIVFFVLVIGAVFSKSIPT